LNPIRLGGHLPGQDDVAGLVPQGDDELPGVLVDAEVQHGRSSSIGVGHCTLPTRSENPHRFDVGRAFIDINARNARFGTHPVSPDSGPFSTRRPGGRCRAGGSGEDRPPHQKGTGLHGQGAAVRPVRVRSRGQDAGPGLLDKSDPDAPRCDVLRDRNPDGDLTGARGTDRAQAGRGPDDVRRRPAHRPHHDAGAHGRGGRPRRAGGRPDDVPHDVVREGARPRRVRPELRAAQPVARSTADGRRLLRGRAGVTIWAGRRASRGSGPAGRRAAFRRGSGGGTSGSGGRKPSAPAGRERRPWA
jgi:hypothetical protein